MLFFLLSPEVQWGSGSEIIIEEANVKWKLHAAMTVPPRIGSCAKPEKGQEVGECHFIARRSTWIRFYFPDSALVKLPQNATDPNQQTDDTCFKPHRSTPVCVSAAVSGPNSRVLQQKYCNAKSICFQIVFYHWSHVVNLLLPWCTWGKLRQGPHVLYQGIRSSSYVLVSAVWEHHSKLSGSLWPRVLKYTWTYGTSISYY